MAVLHCFQCSVHAQFVAEYDLRPKHIMTLNFHLQMLGFSVLNHYNFSTFFPISNHSLKTESVFTVSSHVLFYSIFLSSGCLFLKHVYFRSVSFLYEHLYMRYWHRIPSLHVYISQNSENYCLFVCSLLYRLMDAVGCLCV